MFLYRSQQPRPNNPFRRLVQNNHKAVSKQLKEAETNTITTVRQYSQSIENYLRFLGLCILARLHFISRLGADIKQTAGQILTMIFVMSGELNILKAIIMQLDRGIDNGEHFVLEDATGRSFPIHLKTIISWEAFDVILKDRFKGRKGERRIRRKFYSLHESASQLEIDRSVKFVDAFVPNQKVDMSLICRAPDVSPSGHGDTGLSSCPWCRTASPGQLGVRVKCVNCKRHFTRVVIEADDVNKAPFVPSAPRPRALHFERGQSAPAGSLAPGNEQHEKNELIEQRPGDQMQKGVQEFDPESESDEENISGLAHITLQTRRIRPPKGDLSLVPENAVDTSMADGTVDPSDDQDWNSIAGNAGDDRSENGDNPDPEDTGARRDREDAPLTTGGRLLDNGWEDDVSDADDRYLADDDTKPVPKQRSGIRRYGSLAHSTEEDCEYANDYLSRAGLEVGNSDEYYVPQRPPPNYRRANTRDIKRHNIPNGYYLKYWDPDEEPIRLLGNIFDARSLGKWIVDWTFARHGEGEPARKLSGDVWLVLLKLAGKIKRAETATVEHLVSEEDWLMLRMYITDGDQLMQSFCSLLRKCEAPMLQAAEDEEGRRLGTEAGFEFVKTMFGKDRQLEVTEGWLRDVRAWIYRFEHTCESIIRPEITDLGLRPLSPIPETGD